MANAERGELDIELDGKIYTLIPSNNAFCEIEDKLNCSILDVFERYQQDKPRIKDVTAIFWACLKKSENMSWENAGELVSKYGMAKFSLPCLFAVSKALTGDSKKKDEAKVETESLG